MSARTAAPAPCPLGVRAPVPTAEPDPREIVVGRARATTRAVGRTFALACRLLPREVRDDVYLLYLVFRTLDDLVDAGDPAAALHVEGVRRWAHGDPHPATVEEVAILERLAERHRLPREAFLAFCEGMRSDLAHEPPAEESDVDRYCFRVAGSVGLVLATVLGVERPEVALRSAAVLGIAMQRTNILRDIDEDAGRGRRYVAASALGGGRGLAPGRRAELLREQIARADACYEEGLAGVRHLRRGRRAIAAAGAMYREILRQIERDGYGERPGRAVVSTPRKLLVGALAAARA